MKYSISILTIPERRNRAANLQKLTGGNILCDFEYRGSWQNHRRGLEDCQAPYHLILEDDIRLCNNFLETVNRIAGLFPNNPVSFFNMRYRKNINTKTKRSGQLYFSGYGVTGQAILYPEHCALSFLKWNSANIIDDSKHISCDARRWFWASVSGTRIIVTQPNLVEHELPCETTIRTSRSTLGDLRRSGDFIGDSDPLSLPWEEKSREPIQFYDIASFAGYWERNL